MSKQKDESKDDQEKKVAQYFQINDPLNFFQSANTTDDKAQNEQNTLFKGDLSDIETWLKHEQFRLQQRNEDSERSLREENAKKAYNFSVAWAIFIGVVVLSKATCPKFNFSETEYISTIGTLSITILTYYLVVVRHLFSRGK